MFEKVNPMHPDKVADRISGAIVDLAYAKSKNPKIAVECLIGHGYCNLIIESSVIFENEDIEKIVHRISKDPSIIVNLKQYPQDVILNENQEEKIRCGDNGIFKGVPITQEQKQLSKIAKDIYSKYNCDGKYVLDGNKLIICQSNARNGNLRALYPSAIINPLGEWTGGLNVDTGATNRKLGSDMGDAVTGGGLCLSADSEYLAEDLKWHKISDYKTGKIAEWLDGKLHFVEPIKYIHNENDSLIHIYNNTKLSMCLTPYHKMLIKTSKGNLIKKTALEIANKLYNQIGNSGSILHTFTYDNKIKNSFYKDISDYRLQVAFCADGTILKNKNKWNGRIRVKKLYKKQRLRELLKNKVYLETQDGDYSIFYYNFPLTNKSLYECFKTENWAILKDEVFLWDGNAKNKVFRTTKKEDADFIQFVLQSYGESVGIIQDNRIGKLKYIKDKEYETKSILYTCKVYNSKTTQLRKSKSVPIKVDFLKGSYPSYCFEVPSHNLIIRHNNKIFITGNCGKDLSKADVSVNIYCYLKAQELGREYKISCAIGDDTIDGKPYSQIVKIAKEYIDSLGGFEKFAEWGLI